MVVRSFDPHDPTRVRGTSCKDVPNRLDTVRVSTGLDPLYIR